MNVLKTILQGLTIVALILANVSCTENFQVNPTLGTPNKPQKQDPKNFKWTTESNPQGQLVAEWTPADSYPELLGLKIIFYKGDACQQALNPAANLSTTSKQFTANFVPEDSQIYTYKLIKLEDQNTEVSLTCSEPIQFNSPFSFISASGGKLNATTVAAAPFSGKCLPGHKVLLKEQNHAPSFTLTCTSNNWSGVPDLSYLPGTFSGILFAEFINSKDEILFRSELTINVDTILPTLSFDTLSTISSLNQTNYIISGACSEGDQTVNIAAGSLVKIANCIAGTFSETFDFSSTPSGQVTVAATHADSFGNSVSIQEQVNKNSQPPIIQAFKINADAPATNLLSVSLDIDVLNATQMFIASDAACSLGAWETYSATKAYTLQNPNTINTVYAKFRDNDGNQTTCESDSITHDNVGPLLTIGSPIENFYVNSLNQTNITLSGTCNEANASILISGPNSFTGSAICTGTTFSQIVNLSPIPEGNFQLTFEIKDSLNNLTSVNSPNFIKDTLPPAFSFTLNNGDANTNLAGVTLNITQTQAIEVYITNDNSCSSGGVWSTISATKPWTLPVFNAENTVYAKARDAANNETSCTSDKIVHYTNAPTLSLSTPTTGTYINSITQTAVTFSGGCSDDGQAVQVSVNGDLKDSPLCTSSAWTSTLDLSSLSDGNVAIHLTHKSALEVPAPAVDKNFAKDTIIPTISNFKINNGDLFTNTLTATLTLDTADGTSMYITNNALCLSGGSWQTYSSPIAGWTLPTANSINTVYAMVRDTAGNNSACESRVITHDNVIPTLTVSSPLANSYINLQNKDAFTVSGTCSEHGRDVRVQIDSLDTNTPCSSGNWTVTLDVNSLADNTAPGYTLTASQVRVSGNSGTTNRIFLKNTQRPTLTLANAPTGVNSQSTLNVSVTGDSTVTHYRYLLLAPGDLTSCADSANYTGADVLAATAMTGSLSAQGIYKLCIIARNAANNWIATPEIISWTRDTEGPKILTVDATQANGSYESGTTIQVRVNFNENVTVTGSPRILLETGDVDRYATYTSGTGTNALIFSYQIQNGDFANFLDYKSTSSLELNAGTLKDSLGFNATLTLPVPSQPGSLSSTRNIVVDAYNYANSIAVLSGFPLGSTYNLNLNINVSGIDVVAYKYKIGKTGVVNCSSTSGYSDEVPVATPITDTLSGLVYGDIVTVCALGKNSSGFWQKGFAATGEYFQYNQYAINYNICDSVKTSSEPNGRLFDSGGPSTNYKNSENIANCNFTINSSTAPQPIKYWSNTEGGYDFLKIYDASNQSSPLINTSGVANSTVSIPSGNTFITFSSDGSQVRSGFEITWGNAPPIKSANQDLTNRFNQTPNSSLNILVTLSSVTTPVVIAVDSPDTTVSTTSTGPFVKTLIVSSNTNIYIQTKTPVAANIYKTIPVAFGESIVNWYVATTLTTINIVNVTSDATNRSYAPGEIIDIKVKLSNPVTVSGTAPSFSLNSGGTATYFSGSGTDELIFRYTVAEGQTSDDLGYTSSSITNSVSIKSYISGENINGTLPLPASPNSLIQNKDIIVHALVPGYASLVNPPAPVNFQNNFSLNLNSNNTTHYKYKFGKFSEVSCTDESGYSTDLTVATPIELDQTSSPEDLYKLCLVAQISNGKWQQFWSATEYSWRRFEPVVQTYSMCSSTSSNNSKGILFDSGGPNGDYNNSENCTFTINNSAAITLNVGAFNTEPSWDKLSIYDGTTSDTALLLLYSGTISPPNTYKTTGNKATVHFSTDGSGLRSGFAISWNAVPQLDIYSPALMNFTTIFNANLNAVYTSNQLAITNIYSDVTASVSDESAFIRNVTKNSRWNKSTIVSPNDTLELKATSPNSLASTKNIVVNIGNRSTQWSINTNYPAPTAVIFDAPTEIRANPSLKFSVGGTNVVSFLFAIPANGNCAAASYSANITTLLNYTTTFSLPTDDGLITLCVRGTGAYGNVQAAADATAMTFPFEGLSVLSLTPNSIQQVAEGSSQTLTFSLSRKKLYAVNLSYEVRGTAQGSDFHNLSDGSITIPAGQLNATLNLNIATNPNTTGTKNLIINIVDSNANVATYSESNHAEFYILDSETSSIYTQKMVVGKLAQCAILSNGKLKCWGLNNKSQVSSTGYFYSTAQEITIAGETAFQDVSTTYQHTCAIGNSSKLYCWGDNNFGQVGANKSGETQSTPIEADLISDTYSMVTTGEDFTCAINTSHSVKCWGRNNFGQLGVGDLINKTVPTEITGFKAQYISAGIDSVCAISHPDNKLYCWGSNNSYKLGDNTNINKSIPTLIDSGTTYSKVSVGSNHACAITSVGTVKCWGANNQGQLGNGGSSTSQVPVLVSATIPGTAQVSSIEAAKVTTNSNSANNATCALTSSSSTPANALYCWGITNAYHPSNGSDLYKFVPTLMTTPTALKSISMAGYRMCGIDTNNAPLCWGSTQRLTGEANNYLSVSPSNLGYLSQFTNISNKSIEKLIPSSSSLTVNPQSALVGTKLFSWGANSNPFGDYRSSLVNRIVYNFINVSNGNSVKSTPEKRDGDICVINSNDKIVCHGKNDLGEFGPNLGDYINFTVIDPTDSYLKVEIFNNVLCAINTNNKVKCAGRNDYSSLGREGLPATPNSTMTQIADSSNYIHISIGVNAVCGITDTYQVKCWGSNWSNALGRAGGAISGIPTSINSALEFNKVFTSSNAACAITKDTNKLYCWGNNPYYLLGDGTNTSILIPTAIDSSESYKQISFGDYHTCGVTTNDTLKCWGIKESFGAFFPSENRTISGFTINHFATTPIAVTTPETLKSVAAMLWGTCVVSTTNKLYCIGRNSNSQFPVPTYNTTPYIYADTISVGIPISTRIQPIQNILGY